MSAKNQFFETLRAEFFPSLRRAGFKGSGQHFRRVLGEVIHTIHIQPHKSGERCAANLGLHLTFLPLRPTGGAPSLATIQTSDCEFTTRLALPGQSDFWWEYGGRLRSPAKQARHLMETYQRYGAPQFTAFDETAKVGAMLSLEDLATDNPNEAFGDITPQRGALAMARIHQHLGDRDKARAFAMAGLTNLGRAVALKPSLRDIGVEISGSEISGSEISGSEISGSEISGSE